MTKSIKFFLPLLAIFFGGLFIIPSQNMVNAKNIESDKVDICHATNSQSNPYVQNHPDKSGDVNGHDGHNGPVWYSGIADHSWGDIIPPFDYDGGHYDGKNWTAAGQDIWNNGCVVPNQVVPSQNAALNLTKTNDKEGTFVNPGMDVTYTLVVSNNGEGTIYNVEVTDMLPADFNYKAGSAKVDGVANEPTITGNILVWHIGNLPENQSATLVYIATADTDVPKGIYTNIAQAQGMDRFEKTISTEEVRSSIEVRIPSVLSETTIGTPTVLPITGEEIPVWPLLLTTFGSTLAIIEQIVRKNLSK